MKIQRSDPFFFVVGKFRRGVTAGGFLDAPNFPETFGDAKVCIYTLKFVTPSFVKKWSGWWFQIFFYFHPYLGKIPNLTNIFQRG